MTSTMVIGGARTYRGFVTCNNAAQRNIQFLQDFISVGKEAIVDAAVGLCYSAYIRTGTRVVGNIADVCGRGNCKVSEGYVIYDPEDDYHVTYATQYAFSNLYEGNQLELRKEFAQLCIEYLEESIRI